MDRTKLFIATVKAVRLQKKSNSQDSTLAPGDRCRRRRSSEFLKEACDVYSGIRKLRHFLLLSRRDYVDPAGLLLSGSGHTMTNDERDALDSEIQLFLRTCADRVRRVQKWCSKCDNDDQADTHRRMICDSLGDNFKVACTLYSEQSTIRAKRIIDEKKHCRLQQRVPGFDVTCTKVPRDSEYTLFEDFSPDEESQFSAENEALFAEMNSMATELKQIEDKVIEITKLQNIFTDNVLTQTHQLDEVASATVMSAENIEGGNQEIRNAIKNKATLRIWILFILIVCTVALLFLDWYS